jgi:hypothetical protein
MIFRGAVPSVKCLEIYAFERLQAPSIAVVRDFSRRAKESACRSVAEIRHGDVIPARAATHRPDQDRGNGLIPLHLRREVDEKFVVLRKVLG